MTFTTEQQAVIDSPATRIACQAVPGSGKTATMVGRIVRMIEDGTIDPRRTAIVTLTNAAANEFSERLADEVSDLHGPGGLELDFGFLGTIHGLALATIRYHGDKVAMISDQLSDQFLDEIIERLFLKTTRNKIRRDFGTIHERSDDQIGAIAYRAKLESLEAMEVGNLIGQASKILSAAGDAAFGQGNGYDALFVDEFQDTSEADYRFLAGLKTEHFFVIGDPNQSIFGFRGASPKNFHDFARIGGSDFFRLTGSFRCSPAICGAASNLFEPTVEPFSVREKGSEREREHVFTLEPGQDSNKGGKFYTVASFPRNPGSLDGIRFAIPSQELEGILEMFHDPPGPLAKHAILCRYTRQVTAISSILKASGIPVMTPEPAPPGYRQAIAAAQLMVLGRGSELARLEYEAAFGVPVAGPICASIGHVVNQPGSNSQTVYQALLAVKVPEDAAKWFFRLFRDSETIDVDKIITIALVELQGFFRPGLEGDGLTVSTIHAAKGREWDHVLIPAMEELTMPGPGASEERTGEEKRVFYVAVTRARLSVTCTFCDTRDRQFSNGALEPTAPSRFLKESGII